MQFPPSFLDEIRQRLRPSAVLGKDLRLIPKGRGEFMALCPFHKEKSPSFSISDDKEFYHCFGCGAHGDVIRFMVEFHKLSFPDAVTQLAAEAGLALPKPETIEQKQARERSDILKELMQWTASWYQTQLKTAGGDSALQYLKRRGLGDEVLDAFRIGYAPESRTALKTYLVSKGGQIADMVEAGLLIQPESGDAYDRFRGRVMFPIVNVKGEVIAFGGRALKEDQQPKYLNSPETPLFHKGRQLYNFARARAAAKTENRLVVVEGYMDVIALYRAGIHTAVAPLGTALTEDQLHLLWSVVPEPILCLDGDAAGLRAMQRAAHLALPRLKAGHSLKSAFLPKGQDPDDVLSSAGAGALSKLLEHTEPLAEMVWRFEEERIAPQTPEQRAALEKAVLDRVQSIEDKSVRDHYRQFMQEKLWNAKRLKKNVVAAVALPPVAVMPKRNQLESAIVGLILDAPALLLHGEVEEYFTTHDYAKPELSALIDALLALLDTKDFSAISPESQAEIAADLEPALETQGFAPLLNALKTHRFVDKSRLFSAETVSLAVWRTLVAELQAEQIAGEYEQFVREWWEVDPEKVEAFREQKEQTDAVARKARLTLMNLLEHEG
jgi:DNA primase